MERERGGGADRQTDRDRDGEREREVGGGRQTDRERDG